MVIREYRNEDEQQWLRCRIISFMDCSYYDYVLRCKEQYKNPSVCLVAEENGTIAGLIDIEYETAEGEVCWLDGAKGGVLWHLAVLPEYRNAGLATKLWTVAKNLLLQQDISRCEVWTQDDPAANHWYKKQGFTLKYSYLNAYIKGMPDSEIIKKYINLDAIGKIYGIRTFNFEAPIERRHELEKICYRLHEVRYYQAELV